MLQVNFNGITLQSDQPIQTLPASKLNDFSLSFDTEPGKFYTVEMVDNSGPYPYVHYLVTNIPGGKQLSSGDEIYPYLAPNPPTNSKLSNYKVTVYEDYYPINEKSTGTRENFRTPRYNRLASSLKFNVIAQPNQLQEITTIKPNKQITSTKQNKSNWIKSGSTLNEQEQKYCRCVLQVAAKQPGQCNMEKAWFEQRQNETCYNPYAVCAKTVGTSSRVCGENYNWVELPDDMLNAYANLNNIPIKNYSRKEVLNGIVQWKAIKSKK